LKDDIWNDLSEGHSDGYYGIFVVCNILESKCLNKEEKENLIFRIYHSENLRFLEDYDLESKDDTYKEWYRKHSRELKTNVFDMFKFFRKK